MKLVFTLIVLAFATAACLIATPAKVPVKKAKTDPAASARVTHKTTAAASARHVPVNSRSKTRAGSTVKVKYVRGRNGKLIRVARAAPAPSYQLHPDPERYQQIQQALADKGYFKGEVNGQWGDDSVDALKRFQADQKLDDDGHLSALTLIGLGLGPKHDHDLGTPGAVSTPAATPSIPTSSVPQASTATPVSSAGTTTPPLLPL